MITIIGAGADAAARQTDKKNKQVRFKNWASFPDSISKINNAQIDNEKDLDFVMPIYNSIDYSYNCSKDFGSLWKYCKDELDKNITNSQSFKFKARIIGRTTASGNTRDVEIAVPLKYSSNFWRTF